jgi:hypothetical protein
MAGEFAVMEKLYRLGYEPALTLGNAKSVDIFVRRTDGRQREISVKAISGGGKWPVSAENEARMPDRIYVLLLYRNFSDPSAQAECWVIPAPVAQRLKDRWFKKKAIYCSNKQNRARLAKYKDAWALI